MLLNVGPNMAAIDNTVQIEMVYALQIVMTANTVVLCYVASPRTPQEHAAASTVSQPSCSHSLHAVNSLKGYRNCVSCAKYVMLQHKWSRWFSAADCPVHMNMHMHILTNEHSMQGAQLQQASLANMPMSICSTVWLPVCSSVLICAWACGK